MAKNERFVEVYKQGKMSALRIFVDAETGVQYLWRNDGYAGGLTVLLDSNGKPLLMSADQIAALDH